MPVALLMLLAAQANNLCGESMSFLPHNFVVPLYMESRPSRLLASLPSIAGHSRPLFVMTRMYDFNLKECMIDDRMTASAKRDVSCMMNVTKPHTAGTVNAFCNCIVLEAMCNIPFVDLCRP